VEEELTEAQFMEAIANDITSIDPVAPSNDYSAYGSSHTMATAYKRMTTSIIDLGGRKYRIKNSVIWDKMPSTRSVDVIGAAFNASQFAPDKGTQYGKQSWKVLKRETSQTVYGSAKYNNTSNNWQPSAEGYGVKMNLKDNTGMCTWQACYGDEVQSLSQYAYYTASELHYNEEQRIDAYGRYAHAKKTVTPTFGFSITLTGVGVSVTGVTRDSFEYQYNTHAYLAI
jgi:hypothetical protein